MAKKDKFSDEFDMFDLSPEEQLQMRKSYDASIDSKTGKIDAIKMDTFTNSLIDPDIIVNKLVQANMGDERVSAQDEHVDKNSAVDYSPLASVQIPDECAGMSVEDIFALAANTVKDNARVNTPAPAWFKTRMEEVIKEFLSIAKRRNMNIGFNGISQVLYKMILSDVKSVNTIGGQLDKEDLIQEQFAKYLMTILYPERLESGAHADSNVEQNESCCDEESNETSDESNIDAKGIPEDYRCFKIYRDSRYPQVVIFTDGIRTEAINLNNLQQCIGGENEDSDVMLSIQQEVLEMVITSFMPTAVFPQSSYNSQIGDMLGQLDIEKFRFYFREDDEGINENLVLAYIVDKETHDTLNDVVEESLETGVFFSLCKAMFEMSNNWYGRFNTSYENLNEFLTSSLNSESTIINGIYDDDEVTSFDVTKNGSVGDGIITPLRATEASKEEVQAYLNSMPFIVPGDDEADDTDSGEDEHPSNGEFFGNAKDFEEDEDEKRARDRRNQANRRNRSTDDDNTLRPIRD